MTSESLAVTSPLSVKRVPYVANKAIDIVHAAPGKGQIPVQVVSAWRGNDLHQWIQDNSMWWRKQLTESGAILFKGFGELSAEYVDKVLAGIVREPLAYIERSSPRKEVFQKIYTSTDYPSHQEIFFHNENSYQMKWPKMLLFYCSLPAESGGETPITDIRRVLKRIPEEIVADFIRRGVMYVRNYGSRYGLSWETVFQTEDKEKVENYCRSNEIHCEWQGNGKLRTSSVREAVRLHPDLKQPVWFNHAAFFNIWTLGEELATGLLEQFGEENLPNHTYYADGSPIPKDVIDIIRRAYTDEAISFKWEKGDLLLLDNMLMAHSRKTYTGERKVWVGMGDSCGPAECRLPA